MPSVLTYVAGARMAAHHGELAQARRQVSRAVAVYVSSPTAFAWLGAQAAIALGRLQLTLHDADGARRRADEASHQLARLVSEGTLREQLDQLRSSLSGFGDEPRAGPTMPPSAAELRVLALSRRI